jgi:hypothetical protein
VLTSEEAEGLQMCVFPHTVESSKLTIQYSWLKMRLRKRRAATMSCNFIWQDTDPGDLLSIRAVARTDSSILAARVLQQ